MRSPIPSVADEDWAHWSLQERLVQLAAYHCDVLGVHEEPKGSNDGPWVRKYLRAAGIGFPAPWCAAFVTYLLKQCGYKDFPNRPASVLMWSRWVEAKEKNVAEPKRGDLIYFLNANGTGHIGIVLERRADGTCRTIEANTNDEGSREGFEVCRRVRPLKGHRFIRP